MAILERELAIDTRGLTKQFDRHIAVNQLDLQVKTGEVYGLIGPNGAGKTTLIRMLASAEEPTIGEIYISGERLRRDRTHATIKRRIGYLPDDFPLYDDLSVWDYLDYFARLYELRDPQRSHRLYDVLELVQLVHKRHSTISTLSRGMKQRLSLARTIIHEPILLLLDEPVSGLDPIARMQFRDIIKILREAGMTILISSHVLSDLAELCTSVGIMEMGHLVESTSLPELYGRLSRQYIQLSMLGNPITSLIAEFKHHPAVKEWEILPQNFLEGTPETRKIQTVRVRFEGNLDDRANLLRSLVAAGIPLTEFHNTQDDLESIFLKLGHQQVS